MIDIDDFDAYCFDLDGTVYVGDKLLPGVKETMQRLRTHNKKILFITNSPIRTRRNCLEHLQSLGVSCELDEIITAPLISAFYFLETAPDSPVYFTGEQAIQNKLNDYINITENPLEAHYILVGLDRSFTYKKLNSAMTAVQNGAKLVVMNPDPNYPIPGGYMSDTMAIARAIETASNQPIYKIIGKPSRYYGQKVIDILKTTNDQCLIIGDRLETDIMLGKTNNFQTCLVLTGVSKQNDMKQTNIYPDYMIDNLFALFQQRTQEVP
ncbi:MAG TPA: HAD-IIA family hydrolase [Bacillota bacterium]|nr:HAD-IIA family hydrolase [Bacillota bacterium]